MIRFARLLLPLLLLALLRGQAQAQIAAGDTLQFWSVTYVDWPPLWGQPQHQIMAVCKNAGDHCYVFVETSALQPNQVIIDTLVNRFDHKYYPKLTQKYGPVPDALDHDSNVFILVFDEPNWAGYFDPGQQMPDSVVMARWNRHSSEREILYIAANYFGPSSYETVAHEFGHLLHWQQDHSPEPSGNPVVYWECAFVDEGFSTFAALYLAGNLSACNIMDNNPFFQFTPDIPLIYFSNYDQAELFMLYMYEHFGGWNYISALIGNQLNCWEGVDSTMHDLGYSQHFDDAFQQFCIANYLDDTVYQGGKYGYRHYNFPGCLVDVNHVNFPTGTFNSTVTSYGCDYRQFSSPTHKPLEINFNGDPASKFRLGFIMIKNQLNHQYDIATVIPDSTGHAFFYADSLGSAYTKLVMVVMNVDPALDTTGTASYSYTAANTTGIRECGESYHLQFSPNPVNDRLFLNLPLQNYRGAKLSIIDVAGKALMQRILDKGEGSISVAGLQNGIYLVKIIMNDAVYCGRFVKH